MTGRDALRAAFAAHAARADGVLLGECVGVAGITAGLSGAIVRTPLSESAAVGAAVGMAIAGKIALVELIDPGGVSRAAEALREAVELSSVSNGAFRSPVVVVAVLPETADTPAGVEGLRMVVVADAAGIASGFAAAVEAAPSVLFLADGALHAPSDGEVRKSLAGEPRCCRPGEGATVFAEGAGVALALTATEGCEVVDLGGCRDAERIAPLVARSGRAVFCGVPAGALLSAYSGAFWRLEAPPLHVPVSAGGRALAAALAETLSA